MARTRAVLLGPSITSTEWLRLSVRGFRVSQKTDVLVGVDGGTALWKRLGFTPDFAIGDWDSLKYLTILKSIPHLDLPTHKDFSDLMYAGCAAVQAGATSLLCLGVTGGRPDHQIAMLLDLAQLSEDREAKLTSVISVGEDAEYHFVSPRMGEREFRIPKGQTVSMFALGGAAQGVTIKGFEYPLSQAELIPSSHGLSNRAKVARQTVVTKRGVITMVLPNQLKFSHNVTRAGVAGPRYEGT